jgi:hypothetical protein
LEKGVSVRSGQKLGIDMKSSSSKWIVKLNIHLKTSDFIAELFSRHFWTNINPMDGPLSYRMSSVFGRNSSSFDQH